MPRRQALKTQIVNIMQAKTCLPRLRRRAPRFLTPLSPPLLLLALIGGGLTVSAEGIRNPTLGTFGLGRSGARIAQVDDSTALQHNPANLVFLGCADVAWEQSLVYASAEFTRPDGATTETENPWKPLTHLFAAVPMHDGRWAFGLGVTMPYGLSSEWEESATATFQRQAPRYAQLVTINCNPTVACRVSETLSLAAGLDVMWSQLTLKEYAYGPLPFGLPDGSMKVQGDGVGVSANLAATWEVARGHRLALTCRLPMDVEYNGHFTGELPAPLGLSTRSSFRSEIHFPAIVGVGYGVEVSSKVRLGVDFEWLEFSRVESLPLDIGAPWPGVPPTVPQNWNDTITIGAGGDWQFAPNWFLRASYQFFETPVPDSTFSPTIPDADQHVLTVGLTWRSQRHELGLAYSRVFYQEREITGNQNPAFDGTYDFDVHLLAFSYRYRF